MSLSKAGILQNYILDYKALMSTAICKTGLPDFYLIETCPNKIGLLICLFKIRNILDIFLLSFYALISLKFPAK